MDGPNDGKWMVSGESGWFTFTPTRTDRRTQWLPYGYLVRTPVHSFLIKKSFEGVSMKKVLNPQLNHWRNIPREYFQIARQVKLTRWVHSDSKIRKINFWERFWEIEKSAIKKSKIRLPRKWWPESSLSEIFAKIDHIKTFTWYLGSLVTYTV